MNRVLLVVLIVVSGWTSEQAGVGSSRSEEGFLAGARVLLDAHNCYPEHGQWAD